ncbi:MAG: LysM domain-containing protein [Roseovarius sp.]|uniref:LysM peptidoglycan-binding domain-containing protein n=1 Tax=Roseovarius sp. TaxID=1486281 RepID=UPI0032EF9B55
MPEGACTVRKEDTLSGIARRTGTITSDLAVLNDISDPDRIQEDRPMVAPGPA